MAYSRVTPTIQSAFESALQREEVTTKIWEVCMCHGLKKDIECSKRKEYEHIFSFRHAKGHIIYEWSDLHQKLPAGMQLAELLYNAGHVCVHHCDLKCKRHNF